MQLLFQERIAPVRVGVCFAVFTILFGFTLGGIFGGFEDPLWDHLEKKAMTVKREVYHNDQHKVSKAVGKSWHYLTMAHFHANGIGTAAVSLILLLALLNLPQLLKGIVAAMLGLGSLGYSSFWLFAGLRTPLLGSGDAAKESLKWLAIPSAGLCIVGVALVFVCSFYALFLARSTEKQSQ